MTMNGSIVAVNAVIVLTYLALGVVMLWQARRSLRAWPVSAWVALAGPYIGVGVAWAHLTGWRMVNLPGTAFDRDGAGTLTLRLIVAVVALALVQRIARGKLLTAHDRQRVDGSG